jgi:hypothetical protein
MTGESVIRFHSNQTPRLRPQSDGYKKRALKKKRNIEQATGL